LEANTTQRSGLADGQVARDRSGIRARLSALVPFRTSERVAKRGPAARVSPDDPAGRLELYLRGSKALVMHGRQLPGSRQEIDHLVIGPAGVTVVDSRNYSRRRAKLEGRTLRVGRRDRSHLIRSVVAQAESVKQLLAGTPYAEVPVEAALAWRRVSGVPVLQAAGAPRVVISGTRRIAGEASRPGPLPAGRVQALASFLGQQLTDRG
jgi:hypothetical protein